MDLSSITDKDINDNKENLFKDVLEMSFNSCVLMINFLLFKRWELHGFPSASRILSECLLFVQSIGVDQLIHGFLLPLLGCRDFQSSHGKVFFVLFLADLFKRFIKELKENEIEKLLLLWKDVFSNDGLLSWNDYYCDVFQCIFSLVSLSSLLKWFINYFLAFDDKVWDNLKFNSMVFVFIIKNKDVKNKEDLLLLGGKIKNNSLKCQLLPSTNGE